MIGMLFTDKKFWAAVGIGAIAGYVATDKMGWGGLGKTVGVVGGATGAVMAIAPISNFIRTRKAPSANQVVVSPSTPVAQKPRETQGHVQHTKPTITDVPEDLKKLIDADSFRKQNHPSGSQVSSFLQQAKA